MAKSSTVKNAVAELKDSLANNQRRVVEVRKKLALEKKSYLANSEIDTAAHAEVDQRQATAVEKLRASFQRRELSKAPSKVTSLRKSTADQFFQQIPYAEIESENLRLYIEASGMLHAVIDNVLAAPETGNAHTAESKAAAIAKLEQELISREQETEDAREALAELGIVVAVDPEITPAVFLQWREVDRAFNRARVDSLNSELTKIRGVGLRVWEERQAADANLSAATLHREEVRRSHVTTRQDNEREDKHVAELQRQRAELSEREQQISKDAAPLNKLLNKCKAFLLEKGVSL